ncbi:MAG: twin-arginine translocase TatA/TatE family subunit [Balneolales bacterium]
MGALGGLEWLVIVLVVLLLFGAKKIPELARGMGQGINEFRKASSEIRKEIDKGNREDAEAAKKEEPEEEPKSKGKSKSKSTTDADSD